MRAIARVLMRLYPRPWRERYGDEFAGLLDERPVRLCDLCTIAGAALRERAISLGRGFSWSTLGYGVLGLAACVVVVPVQIWVLMVTKPVGWRLADWVAVYLDFALLLNLYGNLRQRFRSTRHGTALGIPSDWQLGVGGAGLVVQLVAWACAALQFVEWSVSRNIHAFLWRPTLILLLIRPQRLVDRMKTWLRSRVARPLRST